MASRRSQRILLNEWTGVMKKNQKRKANPEERILIDEDSETVSMTNQPSPPKKKSKKDKEVEKASPSKGKLAQKAKSGKGKTGQKDSPSKVKKVKKSDKGKEVQKAITDKREKKKSSGKTSLSKEWFINFKSQGLWLDGYASTPVAYCSMICTSMLRNMKLECIKRLKKTSVWKILNPDVKAYPRLTRLFYLNLQQVSGKDLTLSSKVAGVDIILDHAVFAKVLSCAEKYNVNDYPDKKDGIRLAKMEFFLPNAASTSKQLTHSVLTVEAKILFTILMRCVVPKENSKELLSDRVLYLMYLIMHGFEIDLPSTVMEHMLYSSTKNRNHVLPYANLLPLFFNHFGIPVDDEEKISTGFGMINENSFQRIGIVQTTKGEWKFFSDLSPDELKNKKFSKPKALTFPIALTSTPPNQSHVLEKLDVIENELDELKQGQLELSIEFKKMQFMVSSLHDKTSKIFNSLNLVDVQEETAPVQKESKDSGSTRELFDEHTTEEEDVEVEGTEKDASIDSDLPLGVVKQRKQKEKAVDTITSAELFEEEGTEVIGAEQDEGTEIVAEDQGEETEVVTEKQDEEAGEDEQEEEEEEVEEEAEEDEEEEEVEEEAEEEEAEEEEAEEEEDEEEEAEDEAENEDDVPKP